jgi:hypothetical protein
MKGFQINWIFFVLFISLSPTGTPNHRDSNLPYITGLQIIEYAPLAHVVNFIRGTCCDFTSNIIHCSLVNIVDSIIFCTRGKGLVLHVCESGSLSAVQTTWVLWLPQTTGSVHWGYITWYLWCKADVIATFHVYIN